MISKITEYGETDNQPQLVVKHDRFEEQKWRRSNRKEEGHL